jgi:hypothetical protein
MLLAPHRDDRLDRREIAVQDNEVIEGQDITAFFLNLSCKITITYEGELLLVQSLGRITGYRGLCADIMVAAD